METEDFLDADGDVPDDDELEHPTAPNVVNDTVFEAAYTVSLGALHHAPFSFRVEAGDVLGHDTLTDSVKVRLK